MKGQIATPALMEAVLDPEAGLRTGRVICQVVLMEVPRDDRRFLLADTGITVKPNLRTADRHPPRAVEVAHALGSTRPKVALMAATETVKLDMPETVEADELTRRNRQGEFGDCVIEGPLSFDLAYAADAGARKRIEGSVVGGGRRHALPQPPLGQPDRQGDHVHGRLPVRRRPRGDLRTGRLHVPRRLDPDPAQFACADTANP